MSKSLQKILGYEFRNSDLLSEALTHPSLSKAKRLRNYERMEFLGDSVLALVISELLFNNYSEEKEGNLAKRRAYLVGHKVLAKIAADNGFGAHMKISEGEENIGGRENPANLENLMEAIIGAVFLDGGIEPARDLIMKLWQGELENFDALPSNPKSELQEILQKKGYPVPSYDIIATSGPAHKPNFTIEVKIPSFGAVTAEGASRKVAENLAAQKMLNKIMEKQ